MVPKQLSEMTLDELVAENQRLWEVRQAAKAEQATLQPYLDAAWKAQEAEAASHADPDLEQGIG